MMYKVSVWSKVREDGVLPVFKKNLNACKLSEHPPSAENFGNIGYI